MLTPLYLQHYRKSHQSTVELLNSYYLELVILHIRLNAKSVYRNVYLFFYDNNVLPKVQPNTSDKVIIIKSVHQERKKESLGVILQFSIYYAVVT